MIWFISDTHFYHTNMVIYEARPPWIDRHMIYLWNKHIASGDIVWHLGDFAMSRHDRIPELVAQLNGEIHLIMGNHDFRRKRWYKRCGVYTYKGTVNLEGFLLSHRPQETDLLNLHGHVHGAWKRRGNHINLSVEVRGYRPWNLEELRMENSI
jgi:calcineurin-like phosphoesterase family protein